MSARRRFARRALTPLLVATALGACGSTASTTVVTVPATPTTGPLHTESSPVKITLVSPKNDEVVSGSSVHVTLTVSGGTIDSGYSKKVSPTVGHIHLYMNSELTAMAYATSTDIPVDPGAEYSLYAEWVASDHGSFTPRDITPKIYFQVSGSN